MQLVIDNLARLVVEQKAEKVRIDTERRNAESLQAAYVRLLDKRHRYATDMRRLPIPLLRMLQFQIRC